MLLQIQENDLHFVFEMTENLPVRILHMGVEPMTQEPAEVMKNSSNIQEIQVTGESTRTENHMDVSPIGTYPGYRMFYTGYEDGRNEWGRILNIHTKDEQTGLKGTMVYQFYDGLPVVRCKNILKNEGAEALGLEVVTTFVQPAAADETNEDIRLLIPHNSWQQEIQWEESSLRQLGGHIFADKLANKRIQVCSKGSWSTGEYLPMGCLHNVTKGTMEFWQIEHNGGWNWELQANKGSFTLLITGPNEMDHHWWKSLQPGETFETVPAVIGMVKGSVDETFAALTKYRRTIRRKNMDNETLPVIFNDYMNCLWGQPTTETELPIIDVAAAIGCEYYCIDCGWYADGSWWPLIGEWIPSKQRFPNGLKEVTDYIKSKGMIPGIWLEIEFMGTQCPMVEKVDKSWFMQRHGKPVAHRERYHLDFRNPQVRAYARGVVDRLIQEYGFGYIKMDYNCNAFMGTEYQADSFGDGLLEHNRAYLQWLDDIFVDYPDLVIENCSSGGMRMDYALLSRHSIQSTSDQTDYVKYASIAANAPTAVTPEQSAIWSYPLSDATREQTIFNCVNACLMRIHQSGNMEVLAEDKKEIVREALCFYKKIREEIPKALPFWPLGLAKEGDDWMCLGLKFQSRILLAVWRLGGVEECELQIPALKGKDVQVKVAFPAEDTSCQVNWDKEVSAIRMRLSKMMTARIVDINCDMDC